MTKFIGILTSGGDSPGLNAAIRGIGKACIGAYGMKMVGFRDGFRGMMENRLIHLNENSLSGILTIGGTILGTSRDKPHRIAIIKKRDAVDRQLRVLRSVGLAILGVDRLLELARLLRRARS